MSDAVAITKPVTVHKLTVYVTDFEGYGPDEAAGLIEQRLQRHFGSSIVHEGTKQVEWHDQCDYNFTNKAKAAFKKLFS